MSVGKRIKEARLRKGMTQEQLAAALHVSKGAVGNYESEIAYPKTEILYKLFHVLDVDANYLYQDDMKAVDQPIMAQSELRLLAKYRALNDHGQKLVNTVLDLEYENSAPIGQSDDDIDALMNDKSDIIVRAAHRATRSIEELNRPDTIDDF